MSDQMIVTPIIIPVHQEEEICPKCHKPEKINQVCAHCGYVYEEDETTWSDIIFGICLVVIIIWSITTTIVWLINNTDRNHETLFENLTTQFKYITSLRLW